MSARHIHGKWDSDFDAMERWDGRRKRRTPWDSIGVCAAAGIVLLLMLMGVI